ncbi:MAG: sodium/solute symporter [Planctomycetes bacterium]|nr:sodium/solute symporter [Planctomycetota bacterium]
MHTADFLVFLAYFVLVSGYGLWIYHRKKDGPASADEFFLAEGSLTWWAIGSSIIASNISAEQFIGMSGAGFALGLAISGYEWVGAATLILVALFLIPGYLKNRIYTMPQFLKQRYGQLVATIMAVFWLLVYVFINLTSILYLGALTVENLSGFPFMACVAFLAAFAIVITMGGMKVIGYTDVIQVVVLALGGLATTLLALDLVAQHFGQTGALAGFLLLREQAPGHFHMILDKSNPHYNDLPGLGAVLGGMWVANISYWGCNQYITQRALGADLKTARAGILFAAALKVLMPLIVVLPGIAVYVLHQNGYFQAEMLDAAGEVKPDKSYSALINLLPTGLKGLSFAALTAAIVASLAGKANSIATIFTLDLYKRYWNPVATEANLIRVGRYAILVSSGIAVLLAPQLGRFDQAIQYIQEYTGFISPGVCVIFLLGFFWPRATGPAALLVTVLTIPLSTGFKYLTPDMPFLNRMGYVTLILAVLMVLVSLATARPGDEDKALRWDREDFRPGAGFIAGSVLVMGVLAAVYAIYW